jgi:hypothetical protein
MRLILVPSIITLAVTLLRLVGELQHWSPTFFSPEAGGAGAIVGIVWLVPIFGIYFAIKTAGAGAGPTGAGKAIGFSLLAIVIVFAGFFAIVSLQLRPASLAATALFVVVSVLAAFVQYSAWPSLAKVLFKYGLAARIPVVVVMFFAIMGNWGTHYDVPPPDFPPDVAWFQKFILIGLLPQMIFWIAFTMIIGGLFGAIAVAISGKKAAPQPAT